MRRSLLVLLSCTAMVLLFQNCSGPGASFTTGSVDSASTANPDPTATPTPVVPGDILGLFNFTDVTKVKFIGTADVPLVGAFNSNATLNVDHTQHSYNASFKVAGPLSLSLTCTSAGTLANYNALESALKALNFNTASGSTIPVLDFVTASLQITLRNGTVKSFSVDTASNHLVIDHVGHINAMAFKSFIWPMLIRTDCNF